MDFLSAIFADLRLRTMTSGLIHLGAPWGVRFPSAAERQDLGPRMSPPGLPSIARPPDGGFHLVVEGRCLLEVDGEAAIELGPGDLAVTIGTPGQTVRDAAQTPARLVFDVLPPPPPMDRPRVAIRTGGAGMVTSIVLGGFFFESPDAPGLLAALPLVIHVPADPADAGPRELTSLLLAESSRMDAGAQAVIDSIAGVFFVRAVRRHLAMLPTNGPAATSRTGALLDPEIGGALHCIHRAPQQPWSVASLADRVLMSRSAFAARFTRLVGRPPMAYLTAYRMRRAQELLRGGAAVKEVARHVGYESDAAFSNAFKRWRGLSPRKARLTTE